MEEFSKDTKLTDNILIIHNPNSGKGKGSKYADRLVKHFTKNNIKIGCVLASTSLEFFYDFCKQNSGNANKYTLAIVIGGDGTLSPCVDAMIKNDFIVPIYPFGRGTANDFPTYMKTNKSIGRVVKIICHNTAVTYVDTLAVEHPNSLQAQPEITYAINVACGGAFTNGVTNYSKKSKQRFGKLAYMTKAAGEAFRMQPQILKFTVDGKEYTYNTFLFLILNTTNAGSIKHIIGKASPCDERLNLAIFTNCGICGKMNIALNTLFRRSECCEHIVHLPGKEFKVEVIGEPTKNFTHTDIDGNAGYEYPLIVKLSDKKIPIVSNRRN